MSHAEQSRVEGEAVSVFYLPNCVLCWWKSHSYARWSQDPPFLSRFYAEAISQLEVEVFVVSPWQQRWPQDKRISIKSSLDIVLLLFILSGCFTLQHSFNQCLRKKKEASAWHQVVRVILFLLCALCPLSTLCHLFWCSNLSQVNNILCCLKLCVGNKKASSFCWKYLSVTFHSLSLRLPDKVIIRCCFLPAITFSYNGSNTGKAKGVESRQG